MARKDSMKSAKHKAKETRIIHMVVFVHSYHVVLETELLRAIQQAASESNGGKLRDYQKALKCPSLMFSNGAHTLPMADSWYRKPSPRLGPGLY